MRDGLRIKSVKVLDYCLSDVDIEQATSWSLEACFDDKPKLLVTLNPEIVVRAQRNPELQNALLNADFTVADGVGLTWAAKRNGYSLSRVAGIELCQSIMQRGKKRLSVYFLGSKAGIAQMAAEAAKSKYGINIAGFHHGYFDKNNCESILSDIKASNANLLIAGLGEDQELFLHNNRNKLAVPLMIGAGGTLDVLSGNVKRSPLWTHKFRLEWAYRILTNPSRWHRFPRLIRFVLFVLKYKPKKDLD